MSMFETALSKLASLLGDDAPEATAYGVKNALAGYPGVEKVKNALNPDPQVTNRASMLPIGNYDDGSVGLAIPQSLIDAKEAFGRGEHHSRSQPRGEGGRFVAKDSFDGRLAALDKILVDLDGDGTPDAVMDAPQAPGNALRMAKLTNRPPQSDAGNVPRNPAYDPEDEFWRGLQDPRFGPSPDRTPPPPPSAPPPAPGNALAMRRR